MAMTAAAKTMALPLLLHGCCLPRSWRCRACRLKSRHHSRPGRFSVAVLCLLLLTAGAFAASAGAGAAAAGGGAASYSELWTSRLFGRSLKVAEDSGRGAAVLSSGSCEECHAELEELRRWHDEYYGSSDSGVLGDGGDAVGGAGGGDMELPLGEDTEALRRMLEERKRELKRLQDEFDSLKAKYGKVNHDKFELDKKLTEAGGNWEKKVLTQEAMKAARQLLTECGQHKGGFVMRKNVKVWKGYACEATEEELQRYFDYEPMKLCPDDWFLVQHLIFVRNCFALPKRRCLNRTPPPTFKEPLPLPQSLFMQSALSDNNVRWTHHACKSFACLNERIVGDCRNCFNMSREWSRWKTNFRGSLTIQEVVDMKKGSLRLGLDVGGGTGSFAAHMALHNVTVMTTAMDLETVVGRQQGLPYLETVALRGLIPLWLPHKGRLPFFDNTLDIIHSVNSVKYLTVLEFEELLFEWDRVLRVGGVLWFEMFYAPVKEMPAYVAVIDLLQYKRLYWNLTPKPDRGERDGAHVYLNALLEKPVRPDP